MSTQGDEPTSSVSDREPIKEIEPRHSQGREYRCIGFRVVSDWIVHGSFILTHDDDDAENERHQDCGEQAEEAARREPILDVVVVFG